MLDGFLTVLLVDGLNTPSDHETARLELLRYAEEQAKLKEVAAVYVLGKRLYKLKDFGNTASGQSDPATGRVTDSAASTFGQARRSSALMGNSSAYGGGVDPDFVADNEFSSPDKRVQVTLATMRAIARELYAYPGRKNLIWVTAGLPVTLDPEVNYLAHLRLRTGDLRFSEIFGPECLVGHVSADEISRTAALVSDARLAIYGVDARGVVGSMNSQTNFGTHVFSDACLAAFSSNLNEVASQTGGRVIANPERIGRAVIEAKTDSANSYPAGYYRDRDNLRKGFHKLRLTSSRKDIKLHYRTGYYEGPHKMTAREQASEVAGVLYDGATQARMVLFEALLVPPRSANTFLVSIQFRVSSDAFTTEEAKDRTHRLDLDVFVMAVTHDGSVAARTGRTVDATLSPTDYAQVEAQGLVVPLEISLSPGKYRLGLAVLDRRSGSIGSLDIPLEIRPP